ncbi:MAG: nitrile hydratase subunit beta [Dongiaceae bacterium]
MNGIHDMGGMHGLGAIAPERDEPLWHAPWEARMLGVTRAMTFPPGFNIDRFRHLRELMPPDLYLQRSYYDHWYAVCVAALLDGGLATKEEIESGHAAPGSARRNDAAPADQVWQSQKSQGVFTRKVETTPLFAIGQRVRARTINPTGHTRLPRYARGKVGTVQLHHGGHVFADTNAHLQGEAPQHLYSVAFSMRELWGPAASARDEACLDLWESYLEPA